jgi:hypothetical protein
MQIVPFKLLPIEAVSHNNGTTPRPRDRLGDAVLLKLRIALNNILLQ